MVIKCPNCSQYVRDTANVCPKCGTHLSVKTLKNDIVDATDVDNHLDSPKTCINKAEVFPELAQHLCQHLKTHQKVGDVSSVSTTINTNEKDYLFTIWDHLGYWCDGEPIRLEREASGLCLELEFLATSDCDDEETRKRLIVDNERFQRFRSLEIFSQFIPHRGAYSRFDSNYCYREYALDLGNDIEKASILISEILRKVYLVPLSEKLVIYTDDNEYINIEQETNTEKIVKADHSNKVSIDESNNIYEDDKDYAGIIMKILCFLIPIVGFFLYFIKKSKFPKTAKSYMTYATIGFAAYILLNLGDIAYSDYSEKKAQEEAQMKAEQQKIAEIHQRDSLDEVMWQKALKNDMESDYRAYSKKYPSGKHIDEANEKIKYFEALKLTDDEDYSVKSCIRTFFIALANEDEDEMLSCLNADMTSFNGKKNATKVDAIAFMRRLHSNDIYGVSISMGDIDVKKELNADKVASYTVSFAYDRHLNREDMSLETFASLKGTAKVNSSFRITELNQEKISHY